MFASVGLKKLCLVVCLLACLFACLFVCLVKSLINIGRLGVLPACILVIVAPLTCVLFF